MTKVHGGTNDTALDRAQSAMAADPQDDQARLSFYERLADAELFVLLAREAQGDSVEPRVFPADGGQVVLAFDREARLAAFSGGPAPFAAMSGRALARLLAAEGIGLGLNLGAPSETVLPAEAIAWLADTLATGPEEAEARPVEVAAPGGLPERLIEALTVKLATAEGLARFAYLARVGYEDGRRGHLLAFIEAREGAERALAAAVSEALVFSGLEAGELDVTFLGASDPVSARLAKVGLRFDIPAPSPARAAAPPEGPPRLR